MAGLNLTFQVAEVLGVHNNPGQLPKTAAGAPQAVHRRDWQLARCCVHPRMRAGPHRDRECCSTGCHCVLCEARHQLGLC